MPNSSRLLWPYPSIQDDPWYDKFEALVTASDATGYANREDRQLILASDASFTFNAGTGLLSWNSSIYILSTISGLRLEIAPGNVTLLDGQVFYVNLTRAPITNGTLVAAVAGSTPNTDDAFVIAVRMGGYVYFRTGVRLAGGESLNIFSLIGGGSTTNTYERSATFGVAPGTNSQTATLGVPAYSGSVVGLTAELTRPVTGGTVVITVLVEGVPGLTVTLNGGAPKSAVSTAAAGTHVVNSNDAITVSVVATGYANADSLDGGLTVNVSFLMAAGLGSTLVGSPGEMWTSLIWSGGAVTHASATPLTVGGFAFDPTDYVLTGTSISMMFRAVAANGVSPLTSHVRLTNISDSDIIATLNFVNTTAYVKQEVAVAQGGASGQLDASEKIYMVQVFVDAPSGPSDTINLLSAELRVINTIL